MLFCLLADYKPNVLWSLSYQICRWLMWTGFLKGNLLNSNMGPSKILFLVIGLISFNGCKEEGPQRQLITNGDVEDVQRTLRIGGILRVRTSMRWAGPTWKYLISLLLPTLNTPIQLMLEPGTSKRSILLRINYSSAPGQECLYIMSPMQMFRCRRASSNTQEAAIR